MTSVIDIINLSVCFQSQCLFEGMSFSLQPGEKITITGPSGSGKSTLLRCLMGFAVPDSGVIRILGEDLGSDTIWKLRGFMAYVAQEPDLGEGIVRDALIRPFGYKRNASLSYDEHEALALFETLVLNPAFIDTPISQLSGGEKQRVALISALLLKRPVLLLDEAASALDLTAKQAVRDYLSHCSDLSILSVSHDVRDFSLSDTILDIGDYSGGGSG